MVAPQMCKTAMTSVLLFDVGETILDAVGQQDALMEVHRTALAKFGFKLSVEEYRRLDGDKISQFVPSAMHAITRHFSKPDVSLFNEITEVRSHYSRSGRSGTDYIPGPL